MKLIKSLMVIMLLIAGGCEPSSSEPSGTSDVKGNITSFDMEGFDGDYKNVRAHIFGFSGNKNVAKASKDFVLNIDGEEIHRSVSVSADGTFRFGNFPAGDYMLSFEYNGEEVRYRGNSGQESFINIPENSLVELINVRVSGGKVNIGNVKVTTYEGDAYDGDIYEWPVPDDEVPDEGDVDPKTPDHIEEPEIGVARINVISPANLSSSGINDMDSYSSYLDGSIIHCVLPTYDIVSQGNVEFTVTQSGYLFLALHFGLQGGNGGGWLGSRLEKGDFEAAGWIFNGDEINGPGLEDRDFELAYKIVNAGEAYSLRCNKYEPPYPIELAEGFELP